MEKNNYQYIMYENTQPILHWTWSTTQHTLYYVTWEI